MKPESRAAKARYGTVAQKTTTFRLQLPAYASVSNAEAVQPVRPSRSFDGDFSAAGFVELRV